MIINSLKYTNFRQYKGERSLEFPVINKKNITVILGNNTYGKTTLLQMFNWCFYGKIKFDKDNPDFLLNLEIEGNMVNGVKEPVIVEIDLIHENIHYTICRKKMYEMKDDKVFDHKEEFYVGYKNEFGETKSIDDEKEKRNVMNTILPEKLSDYFFFDTERVSSVSERHDVKEAVQNLLGLETLGNARKHMGNRNASTSVIGRFYATMDRGSDVKIQKAEEEIQKNQEKYKDAQTDIENRIKDIEAYEKRKTYLEEELKNNNDTVQAQKERENFLKLISMEEENLKNIQEEYFMLFSKCSLNFFSESMLNKAKKFLEAAKIDDKGVSDVTRKSILELIERGTCLCGTKLEKGNEAYNSIIKELEFVPPESIGRTIKNFKTKLDDFGSMNETSFITLQSKTLEISRIKKRIEDWEDNVEDLSKRIKNVDDAKRFEEELSDVKRKIKNCIDEKEESLRIIGACESNIASRQKELESMMAKNEKNAKISRYLAYADAIYQWLDNGYQEKEQLLRGELEERVNETFGRMYHGTRRVEITDKYNVRLLTKVNNKEIVSGESEGLNRVKNFAFISGLVNLAKERIISMKVDNTDVVETVEYPLVMDAPFSNTDEEHIHNISKELPNLADQIIMFVMKKDWNYAESVMFDKVSALYNLDKITDTYTKIERENTYVK